MRTLLALAAALIATPALAEPTWCAAAADPSLRPFDIEVPEHFVLEVGAQSDASITWTLRRRNVIYVSIHASNRGTLGRGNVAGQEAREGGLRVWRGPGLFGVRTLERLHETGCKTWPTHVRVAVYPALVGASELEAARLADTFRLKR